MKKIFLLLLVFNLVACESAKPPVEDTPTPTPSASSLRVGAFNIQVFGVSKMSNSVVVDNLVRILSRYDLVLIQEIRDASGASIVNLLQYVNDENNNQYNLVLGARVGRTSSKEQYAFFYRKDLIQSLHSFDYPDVGDKFEREPLVVNWKFIPTGEVFFTVGLHDKPDDAFNELQALAEVYDYAETYYGHNKSILMGDFNADCTYLNDTNFNNLNLRLDPTFTWHIPRTWDTTVATSTDCAYDHLITTGSLSSRVSNVNLFNFKQNYVLDQSVAQDISDHFPVGLTLHF